MTQPIPLSALRAIALHTQGLTTPNGQEPAPTLEKIYQTVEDLMCVQIDTLQMVARAQYLTLWSRLGTYNMADLDRLIYDAEHRRLFEYWGHAASIIPLRDYRWYALFSDHPSWQRWYNREGKQEIVDAVFAQINNGQGMRIQDFDYEGEKRGAWWDWKPNKEALEYLFASRRLMVANRIHFHRVYDIPERVLPDWVADRDFAGGDESKRFFLDLSLKCLGIGQRRDISDYAYRNQGQTVAAVSALINDGTFLPVTGDIDGREVELFVHKDCTNLIDMALDGAIKPERTTFLNPFDSLQWSKNRTKLLWNFEARLEAYTPEPKRRWGYYSLYILHKDRLVGRFDPKLERKSGRLILRSLHLEPGVQPDDELVAACAIAMRDFMKFHGAKDLIIEKSSPAAFSKKLLKTL